MMVVSLHDRISGHANRVRSPRPISAYTRSKPDVCVCAKDENRALGLEQSTATPIVVREHRRSPALPDSVSFPSTVRTRGELQDAG